MVIGKDGEQKGKVRENKRVIDTVRASGSEGGRKGVNDCDGLANGIWGRGEPEKRTV